MNYNMRWYMIGLLRGMGITLIATHPAHNKVWLFTVGAILVFASIALVPERE